MTNKKVFIDGEAGTTGLQILERLRNHSQVSVVSIDPDKRKHDDEKLKIIADVDVVILCLPDDAARKTAKLIQDAEFNVKILDASSAHRTTDDWTYGLPELEGGQREKIQRAQWVSNPGCYATGAILMLRPIISTTSFNSNTLITINAVSGYTGGGKNMIERYQQSDSPTLAYYGLDFNHKHTPEIQCWSGLHRRPVFIPSVANFAQGMIVHTMIDHDNFDAEISSEAIHELFVDYYANESVIEVKPFKYIDGQTQPFLTPHGIEGRNACEIYVFGDRENKQTLLMIREDNLGKGASGAAVQNLNIMLGLPENMATEL